MSFSEFCTQGSWGEAEAELDVAKDGLPGVPFYYPLTTEFFIKLGHGETAQQNLDGGGVELDQVDAFHLHPIFSSRQPRGEGAEG